MPQRQASRASTRSDATTDQRAEADQEYGWEQAVRDQVRRAGARVSRRRFVEVIGDLRA